MEGGNAPSIALTAFFSTVREVDIIFLDLFLFIFVRSEDSWRFLYLVCCITKFIRKENFLLFIRIN